MRVVCQEELALRFEFVAQSRNHLDSVFAFTYSSAQVTLDSRGFYDSEVGDLNSFCRPVRVRANHCPVFAAEVKRPSEWDKISDAEKKEGKIVVAIPPAAELRKEMEIAIKQKLGLEAELVPNPGPRNASRIAAEQKSGVRYFDALIVGTGTAVTLAHDGMLEPIESFLVLPEVKDPKQAVSKVIVPRGGVVTSGKAT
jgi:hypothetical protein